MTSTPKVNSKGLGELEKVQEQFDSFDANVKSLTHDASREAPIADFEPQTRISNRQANTDVLYIKPSKSIGSREQFNEKFRKDWERAKTYVKCIVENYEIIGEKAETWTKPFPGVPAEFWEIPVNKPVAVPGYVAQRISECKYSRLVMEDRITGQIGEAQTYGAMAVKETLRRLDARPVGSGFVSMGS